MPVFYASYVVDLFGDERVLIGIFDSPDKALKAARIAIRQAIISHADNAPEGRYSYYWTEMPLNEFNLDELCSLVY